MDVSRERFNPFGDEPRDMHNMLIWLKKKLNSQYRKSLDDESLNTIEKLILRLEFLDQYLMDKSEQAEASYATDFLDRIQPIWDESNELFDNILQWGSWRIEKTRILKHGYSKNHLRTKIREKSSFSETFYDSIPEKITWKCTPITQKNRTFYIVISSVSKLNAVCSVPSFDKVILTNESGLRVLDRNREPKQWQRNPDPSRIVSIETFIGNHNNIIANTPLVFAPKSEYVTYNFAEDGETISEVSINFSFLKEYAAIEYSDHDELKDLRPLWLIDGQHRVRGIGQNSISVSLDIPFIFFPHNFEMTNAAKIFSEVNTLARDLSDLHKLFMRHRFQISSPEASSDFRTYDEQLPETFNSRKNTLSYEAAAFLTSSSRSPLKSLIKILDENSESNHIIDAKMFVKYSKNWFSKNGPYPPEKAMPSKEINEEIENYFIAFENIVNHYGLDEDLNWEDNKDRWSRNPSKTITKRSIIQTPRNFRALLRLLPDTVNLCSGENRPITVSKFEDILSPLTWVDWNNEDIIGIYVRPTGEKPWKHLLTWMKYAINNQSTYLLEDVMATHIHSEAGKGILSRPAKGNLQLEDKNQSWPTPGNPIYLLSNRPINSSKNSLWSIRDDKNNPRNQKVRMSASKDGSCRYELKFQEWMKGTKDGISINITVDWINANGAAGEKLILKRPTVY